MIKFLDYITKDPKGQKNWAIFFGLTGTIVAIIMTYLFYDETVSFYKNFGPGLSVPIGFLCVYYLGVQKNRGNILGMAANVNEIGVNLSFSNFGFAISAGYYFITHVFGFFDWRNNTNEKGDTRVRDAKSNKDFMFLIFFLVLATAIVLFLYQDKDLREQVFPGIGFIFWGNIIAMYLGIIAQGTMVLRYRYSWIIWITLNFIAIPVQFASGNYIFGVLYSFYQLNAFIGLYAQYTSSNVE